MASDDTLQLPVHEHVTEGVTSAELKKRFLGHHPETEIAVELWPQLSERAHWWALNYTDVGDTGLACEELLMFAVEESVVVPQWVIDAGAEIMEDWGWSPNVEKACAALQARLDEHNRGGGE